MLTATPDMVPVVTKKFQGGEIPADILTDSGENDDNVSEDCETELTTDPSEIVVSPQRPYVCDVCQRGFRYSAYLIRHVRIHTGERPFKCKECGKSFNENRFLKIHTRTHTVQRPHLCEECGKKFTTAGSLKVHMRIHTEERPHLCSECGKGYATSSDLTVHMKIHTEERPFECGPVKTEPVELSSFLDNSDTPPSSLPQIGELSSFTSSEK
eukprot:sb/3470169/